MRSTQHLNIFFGIKPICIRQAPCYQIQHRSTGKFFFLLVHKEKVIVITHRIGVFPFYNFMRVGDDVALHRLPENLGQFNGLNLTPRHNILQNIAGTYRR